MTGVDDRQPLAATEFTPLDSPSRMRRKLPVSPGHLALGIVSVIAALVLIYLFLARAINEDLNFL